MQDDSVVTVKYRKKRYRLNLDDLKRLHAQGLQAANESSARHLTEVFFRDEEYLKRWLKRNIGRLGC